MGRNRSRGKLKTKIPEQLTDITLNDCANNPRKLRRPKVKIHDQEEEYESGSEDKEICHIRDNSTKQESVIVKNDGASGLIYPIDIWFLIAHYIPVEKLCTFALICKGTYKVTQSVHFWKGLYRRFHKSDVKLPKDLDGYCDEHLGLRARVIRILYFLYPPLIKNITSPVLPQYEPYTLQGKKLLLTWREKDGSVWNYYFKFLAQNGTDHQESGLFLNPESDYRILKATCTELVCFPYPQYTYLLLINLGLSSDMRRHKLTLGFSDYTTAHCVTKMKQTLGRSNHINHQIEIDSISKCIVLDWWHPEYPHPRIIANNLNTLCSTEEW